MHTRTRSRSTETRNRISRQRIGTNGVSRAEKLSGSGSGKVSLTATSWEPVADLPLPDWNEAGRRLGAIGRGVGWWIGDWLLYGNHRFGERYVRAKRLTGYDVQTLMNMAYVASRFDPARRRANLSFSHHAELAAEAPEDQERWLARSETEGLSVRCLREARRGERGAQRGGSGHSSPARSRGAGDELVCPRCGVRLNLSRERE